MKNICVLCMPEKHAMENHVRQGIAALFLFKYEFMYTYTHTHTYFLVARTKMSLPYIIYHI